MRAAIYARKSTEQHGVADEVRSVARQVEHARAFAASRGWTVEPVHEYVDDGISGAEFERRPAFLRLMNALTPRPAFDVLVMSEESRLGREQIETAYALKTLMQAGVRVFYYLDGQERTLDTPMDKLLLSVSAFADELERERARQRTKDALSQKARAGHVTGGRVFGYDNVDVPLPDGSRSHVERRINEAEAAVVRRAFTLAAEGVGVRRIARILNDEGHIAPRAQRGRPSAWAPSSVYAVLQRELYRGVVVWNQTRKRDKWGKVRPEARSPEEWMRTERPDLRIVDEALWQAANTIRDTKRAAYLQATAGLRHGRACRACDRDSKYLLPGFARCGHCGGGLKVVSRQHGGRRAFFYVCSSWYDRGPSVCSVRLMTPMRDLDAAVLDALREDVLRPEVVERAVALAVAQLEAGPSQERLDRAEQACADLGKECERLAAAIAAGGQLEALLELLKAKQEAKAAAQGELDALRRALPSSFETRTLRAEVLDAVAEWREVLTETIAAGRDVLRGLLDGPLLCHPEPRDTGGRASMAFTGMVALGRLLKGRSCLLASPAGFEPAFQP
jgi:site-specific DNA recombinase